MASERDRPPIIAMSSKDFTPLLIRFTSSLEDAFTIDLFDVAILPDQGHESRQALWKVKFRKILKSLQQYQDRPFIIFSDIDIQFFRPFRETLATHMRDLDMAFQQENDFREVNLGLFCCKPKPAVSAFFEEALRRIEQYNRIDQTVVNDMIYELGMSGIDGLNELRLGRLPREFFNWSSGRFPQDMICHHANCTLPLYDKWQQLDLACRVAGHQARGLQQLAAKDLAGAWTLTELSGPSISEVRLQGNGAVACADPYEFAGWTQPSGAANLLLLGGAGRVLATFDRFYSDTLGHEMLAGEAVTFGQPAGWRSPRLLTLHRKRR